MHQSSQTDWQVASSKSPTALFSMSDNARDFPPGEDATEL